LILLFPHGFATTLYRLGRYAGEPDVGTRIANALRRAGRLSGFASERGPYYGSGWVLETAMLTGDSTFVRERIDLYLDVNPEEPDPDRFDFTHWLIYNWLGDTTQLASFRQHADELPPVSALDFAVRLGFPLDDVEYYSRRARENAVTTQERNALLLNLQQIALVQGRVADAWELIDSLPPPPLSKLIIQLALAEPVSEYEERAEWMVSRIEDWLANVGPAGAPEELEYIDRVCHVELWRVTRGDTSNTRRRVQELRTTFADVEPLYWHECPLLLEALLADGTAQADATLERLDEYMKQGPPARVFNDLANLIIARLHARRGNAAGALAASRRRHFMMLRWLIPAYLREECLSARAAGDPAGGVQACNHYLTLRPDQPTVQPLFEEWEQVRAKLAVLVGEREGRGR
jgi:hypothetical protein